MCMQPGVIILVQAVAKASGIFYCKNQRNNRSNFMGTPLQFKTRLGFDHAH